MIYLNLIPKNMWYLNLRKMLKTTKWKQLSQRIRKAQNYTCFCCKINASQLPKYKFHAHEAWWFDDQNLTVSLKAILCVCEKCHTAIHFGFAGIKNKHQESLLHIMKVNKWSNQVVRDYIDGEFEIFYKRSKKEWLIDLVSFENWLDNQQLLQVKEYINNNHLRIKSTNEFI